MFGFIFTTNVLPSSNNISMQFQNEAKKKYETQQLPGYLERINDLLTENQGGNLYFIGSQVTFSLIALSLFYNNIDNIKGTTSSSELSLMQQLFYY